MLGICFRISDSLNLFSVVMSLFLCTWSRLGAACRFEAGSLIGWGCPNNGGPSSQTKELPAKICVWSWQSCTALPASVLPPAALWHGHGPGDVVELLAGHVAWEHQVHHSSKCQTNFPPSLHEIASQDHRKGHPWGSPVHPTAQSKLQD